MVSQLNLLKTTWKQCKQQRNVLYSILHQVKWTISIPTPGVGAIKIEPIVNQPTKQDLVHFNSSKIKIQP